MKIDAQIANVFSALGNAIYLAQALEFSIINFLVALEHLPKAKENNLDRGAWAKSVDAYYDNHLEKTFGQLLSKLKPYLADSDDLKNSLDRCLSRRNFVAHRFLNERNELLHTAEGRGKVIRELEQCQQLFRDTNAKIEMAVAPIRQSYGLTDESHKAGLEKHLRDINSDL